MLTILLKFLTWNSKCFRTIVYIVNQQTLSTMSSFDSKLLSETISFNRIRMNSVQESHEIVGSVNNVSPNNVCSILNGLDSPSYREGRL